MTVISERGPSISEEQITELEDELDAQLSDAYRQFLLLNNGGKPEPDVVDVVGLDVSPTDVQVFFGLGRNVESSDLAWNLNLIVDRCPGYHVLPIACDSGGNVFCLKVGKGIASEVVYCDLTELDCTFYEVAPSFDEFMRMIRTLEQWQ